MEELESFLQQKIFPELEQGRPGWDKPHTEAVVHYLKEIIAVNPSLRVDFPVLLIAAYAHDWGYSGLFEQGKPLKLQEIMDAKKQHMIIGVEKVTQLLNDSHFNFLSHEQKSRVTHLVDIHDKLKELKATDELILMEADTLGALDVDRVKPFADKESSDRYIQGVEKKRLPLFITEYGKKKAKEYINKRKNYYK